MSIQQRLARDFVGGAEVNEHLIAGHRSLQDWWKKQGQTAADLTSSQAGT
jgi:hypothetical protein